MYEDVKSFDLIANKNKYLAESGAADASMALSFLPQRSIVGTSTLIACSPFPSGDDKKMSDNKLR